MSALNLTKREIIYAVLNGQKDLAGFLGKACQVVNPSLLSVGVVARTF